MPILLILGAGALLGYIVAPTASANLSAVEGAIAGIVIGAGAAAVYVALKKLR